VLNDKEEKIGHIFDIHAKKQTAINKAAVGDIVALAKMDSLKTGDTLCDAANVIKIAPPQYPSSMMVMGIGPKARGDEDKMSGALARILEEDPTVTVKRDAVVKQTQISGMGELHLNVIMDKMKAKFGVEVALTDPKIPYQETIRATSAAQGKYKKQSGGRGQYGDCHIEFLPNPGGEFEFVNDIFGGAIPAKFIPAVEKGLVEAMEKGYVAGYPIIGIKARLYDGSFHDVDSSENAFKVAASFAMKAAFEKARPCLLEPVMEVEIVIPEEYMGDVIGNINSKRGRVLGMEAKGNKQVVKALVPQMEMAKYAIELRSIARGRGYYSMKFSSYEEVPKEIEDKIVAEAEREKEQE
jgi:elongation factor G